MNDVLLVLVVDELAGELVHRGRGDGQAGVRRGEGREEQRDLLLEHAQTRHLERREGGSPDQGREEDREARRLLAPGVENRLESGEKLSEQKSEIVFVSFLPPSSWLSCCVKSSADSDRVFSFFPARPLFAFSRV